jgi:hypothetical protein
MAQLKGSFDQVSGLSKSQFDNKNVHFDQFLLQHRGQRPTGDRAGVPMHYMELMVYLREKVSATTRTSHCASLWEVRVITRWSTCARSRGTSTPAWRPTSSGRLGRG